MSTYDYRPGLGNVGSYQVSGIPYSLGPQGITNPSQGDGPHKIVFPAVTNWIKIINTDESAELQLGYSALGLSTGNHAFVVSPGGSLHLDVKVTELYYTGSTDPGNVGFLAGLTYITTDQINNASVSPSGTNWSGSHIAVVG